MKLYRGEPSGILDVRRETASARLFSPKLVLTTGDVVLVLDCSDSSQRTSVKGWLCHPSSAKGEYLSLSQRPFDASSEP